VVDKGVLTATGHVEYGLETKTVSLKGAAIDGIQVDYVHTAPPASVEREQRGKAAPDLVVRISELRLTRSTVGFVNKATTPPYR